jgi:hypothetical protein
MRAILLPVGELIQHRGGLVSGDLGSVAVRRARRQAPVADAADAGSESDDGIADDDAAVDDAAAAPAAGSRRVLTVRRPPRCRASPHQSHATCATVLSTQVCRFPATKCPGKGQTALSAAVQEARSRAAVRASPTVRPCRAAEHRPQHSGWDPGASARERRDVCSRSALRPPPQAAPAVHRRTSPQLAPTRLPRDAQPCPASGGPFYCSLTAWRRLVQSAALQTGEQEEML